MIIGSNLLFFKNLSSTNTRAAELLRKDNLQEGTIVYTNHQLSGRGFSGNSWESEDGKNLLISVVLFPSFINPEDQFHLSMAISLGICDFLIRYVPFCTIKWPNDIYVNNDKIAGILVESSIMDSKIEYSIAGIGLNINQENFTGGAPNPVSLLRLTGRNYDLDVCLNQLATDLDGRYKQLIAGKSGQTRKEYISKLFRLNEWCEYKDLKSNFTGRILTISDSGRIIIEMQTGEIAEYSFKELEFIL